MRKVLKVLKWIGLSVLGILVLVALVGGLFLTFSPQFGGKVSDEQEQQYLTTGHYADGIFLNEEEIVMQLDCHSITKMIQELFEPDPNVAPKQDIQVLKVSQADLSKQVDTLTRLTWLGHSSFLVETNGHKILLDPVFGQYAAPHPWLGRRRYNSEMPFELDQLEQVDAVIISHDHYDHLDYPSIKKLKAKVSHFFVPLGVGNHLRRWKIEEERIHELDWWEEFQWGDMKIVLTPSRHMSGRGLSDQSATLWGSWVISGPYHNLYFSGDGGYGEHFKAIGDKYGPFDIGLMECGQYNKLWANVHMMPEQTVQAGLDVKADRILPIHWGAFTLATHSWTDPVERVTAEAEHMNLPITTPQIGQPVTLGQEPLPMDRWWETFQ